MIYYFWRNMGFIGQLKSIDKNISRKIHELDHAIPTFILYPFTAFFHPGLIWIPYTSILYLSNYDLGFTFLYVVATLVCLIFTTILKKMLKRYISVSIGQDQHWTQKYQNLIIFVRNKKTTQCLQEMPSNQLFTLFSCQLSILAP